MIKDSSTSLCVSDLREVFSIRTKVRFVRPADLHPPKMLRDGRMAGLVKLHRGDRPRTERQQWAGSDRIALEILIGKWTRSETPWS